MNVEVDVPTRPTLYFLHAPGCEACAAMKPVLSAFWQRNRHRVNVVPVDLSRVEWKAKSWEPELTPTLLLRFPDGSLSEKLEGYDEEMGPKETFRRWFLSVWKSHGA